LFHQLLADVRSAVIGRVFAYQPRRIEITRSSAAPVPEAEAVLLAQAAPMGGKKKRRRH
jgi:hypothetical protein